jgi:cyclopropane-fatty-acyl-phospholipid synthase
MNLIQLAERGWLPDRLIRAGIRRLLRQRLARQAGEDAGLAVERFARQLCRSDVALETDTANQQHYEVPAEFFQRVLGRHLKYSCGLWSDGVAGLDQAEAAMLELTCRRAGIEDGMEVLDLGCGWGSFSFWVAERFPRCQVLALSNSRGQREFIERQCRQRGVNNLQVVTANIAHYDGQRRFDRIVSIEMFEHVRNYEQLLARIASWMRDDGQLLVHIFCHRRFAYAFETDGDHDWMGRHFFTGGIMPSEDLLTRFQRDLTLRRQWWIDGTHYGRTCEAWLRNLDDRRRSVRALFQRHEQPGEAARVVQRWRMFFMACAELFHYDQGREWGVSHYLFDRVGAGAGRETARAAQE